MQFVALVGEIMSALEWGVQNIDAFKLILADIEAAIKQIAQSTSPFHADPSLTPSQRVFAIIAWGSENLPAFQKVVNDFWSLIDSQKSAIATAQESHMAMMSCCAPE